MVVLLLQRDHQRKMDAIKRISNSVRVLIMKANEENRINCPFGSIKLPIDLWYCKLTKQACPIQAWLDPPEFAKLERYCKGDEKTKAGIKETIQTGLYKGQHHLPGRYLCPLCKSSKGSRRYFYEGDLYWLSDYVDIDTCETRSKIVKAGISLAIYSSKICKDCLDKVLDKIGAKQS